MSSSINKQGEECSALWQGMTVPAAYSLKEIVAWIRLNR